MMQHTIAIALPENHVHLRKLHEGANDIAPGLEIKVLDPLHYLDMALYEYPWYEPGQGWTYIYTF